MGRILVVDDEPSVRRLFVRLLAQAGLEVIVAEDGLTAVQHVQAQTEGFDAIVTDIGMPHLNGIELLTQIRSIDPDVPVVLITGQPELDTAMHAVRLGAFRYLQKPVTPDAFVQEVQYAAHVGQLARAKRVAQTHFGRAADAPVDLAGRRAKFEECVETIRMAYQPIVEIEARRVHAFEALLRFESQAFKGPLELLRVAEELEEIETLGLRIQQRIVADAARLPADTRMFVNLHPQELASDALLRSPLCDIASSVVLEVTERQPLAGDVTSLLESLRDRGFQVAIDDLGAGHSGLSNFAALRPEVAKLDMSLCRNIDTEPVLQSVMRSIVGLCREVGTITVAEGVESANELRAIASLGVDLVQGYYFARPQHDFVDVPANAWEVLD